MKLKERIQQTIDKLPTEKDMVDYSKMKGEEEEAYVPTKKKKAQVAYPVYEKMSAPAQSFRKAFASAKKSGAKEFTWEGRKYNTKVK